MVCGITESLLNTAYICPNDENHSLQTVQVNRTRAQQDIETLKASHMAALQSRDAEALRAIEQSEAARAEEVSHLQESQKAEVGAKLSIVFSIEHETTI